MKRKKLRRSRRAVFGKRKTHPALKALLWIAVCAVVVCAGFFGAKWISERPPVQEDTSTVGNTTATLPDSDPDDRPTTPANPTPPADTPAVTDGIRAFYLPTSALSDTSLLREAAAAGFNAVVFDLKDADGTMYYQFSSSQAKKTEAYAPNALSSSDLKALFNAMKEYGLQPIPRLYAFCDDPAAKVLTDARISHASNHSWAWYDGNPADGAKKWLNPYAPSAQDYVIALAKELKAQGAAAILMDGVQFPTQLKDAYLGEEAATVTKDDALTAFVGRARTALGTDCPLLLGCTEKGALGTDTKAYGGNPLTFGPAVAAPTLSSASKGAVEKMLLRTQVLEQKPTLAPLLVVDGSSVGKVNDAIVACVQGGAKDFILYDADGQYAFASYTLP